MDTALPGDQLQKGLDAQTVINLVPPRELWPQSQQIRNRSLPHQRCGPHLSFLDPFIIEEQFPRVVELITPVLAQVKPFTVKLQHLNYFKHKTSAMLFVEPTFDPPNGLNSLLNALLEVFPQCNDQIKKSSDGQYKPHLSLARFRNEAALLPEKQNIARQWKPQTWVVDEVYLLARKGPDLFVVKHAIPLGGKTTAPHFGLGSLGSAEGDESQMGRTLVACGLPPNCTRDLLMELFKEAGFPPKGAEVCLLPDGKLRNCGTLEFADRASTDKALVGFTHETIYLNPLWKMAFPDVIGGACSFQP